MKRIISLLAVLPMVACTSSRPRLDAPTRAVSSVSAAESEFSDELLDFFNLGNSLSNNRLEKFASAAKLQPEDLQVITDNDVAFHSKLQMIREAKKSIRLAYFIYAKDYSSSLFSTELIKAAQRGVKVQMLVDYNTNYKNLDLFSLLEQEGNGNIEVHFYGRPSRNIVMDAAYLTTGCGEEIKKAVPTACETKKLADLDQKFSNDPDTKLNISNLNTEGSGLFLSGLYTKNPDVMALAVMGGQHLDLAQFKNGAPSTPQQKEDLKKLVKLIWQAKAGSPIERVSAKFQIYFATLFYSETVNPVLNLFTGVLPVAVSSNSEYKKNTSSHTRDWTHVTDFLHHKILIVDDKMVQLGGRNIEDSYHMRPNDMIEKYIFMDTDARATLKNATAVSQAYQNIFSYRPVVASLAEVRTHAPNDFVANLTIDRKECLEAATKAKFTDKNSLKAFIKDCVKEHALAAPLTLAQRTELLKQSMKLNADTYKKDYLDPNWSDIKQKQTETNRMNTDELKTAMVAYIENLPYNKTKRDAGVVRGSRDGNEQKYGKYIHEIWTRALINTCEASSQTKTNQEVILHSAYFFPSSNILEAFGKMVDGSVDCSFVNVKIITNSMQTTDLTPVNVAAEHMMKAFFEHAIRWESFEAVMKQKNPQYHSRAAKFEYFEYLAPAGKTEHNQSLHSKVSVFGDKDMIVGSANADIRSYMMDSNNGFYIRNAPQVVAQYRQFVHSKLSDLSKTRNITEIMRAKTHKQIVEENKMLLEQLFAKFHLDKHATAEQQKEIEHYYLALVQKV